MTNTLQEIDIATLTDHPKNPRLVMRDDVIDGIVANLNGQYPQKHALHVRPHEGGYQILSGHHRKRAAEKAGFDRVWCWVEDMDDDKAFMELATSNNQGELSPLEIGMHALHYVDKATGGRGQKGGLSAYAVKVGRAKSRISEYRDAADVVNRSDIGTVSDLLTKAAHLAAIHKLPEGSWAGSVQAVLKNKNSAKETQELVSKASQIEERYDQTDRVVAVMEARTSPHWLKQIDKLADKTEEDLLTDVEGVSKDRTAFLESLAKEWRAWFIADRSYDLRELERVRKTFEERAAKGSAKAFKADCLEWMADIKDGSVDLLLTDPPYSTDVDDIEAFARSWLPTALSKVKDTGRAYVCIGAYPKEIAAYLAVAMPEQILVWEYKNTLGPSPSHKYKMNWQAVLYYQGPKAPRLDCPVLTEQFSVQDIPAPQGGKDKKRLHAWQKPDELAGRLVRHSTTKGDLVIDPFCCTGTFLLEAGRLGRNAIGCDISEDNLQIAKERGCDVQF